MNHTLQSVICPQMAHRPSFSKEFSASPYNKQSRQWWGIFKSFCVPQFPCFGTAFYALLVRNSIRFCTTRVCVEALKNRSSKSFPSQSCLMNNKPHIVLGCSSEFILCHLLQKKKNRASLSWHLWDSNCRWRASNQHVRVKLDCHRIQDLIQYFYQILFLAVNTAIQSHLLEFFGTQGFQKQAMLFVCVHVGKRRGGEIRYLHHYLNI